MVVRRLFALLLVATSACVASAGCAVDADDGGDDDDLYEGDGNSTEEALVAERQLNGSELPDKTISLTFDDGPGRRTSELADYLAEKGVKAAFFINGAKVAGRQGTVDRIVGRGHLLANHTQNHKQLTKLSAASIIKEISDTDVIITQAQPQGPWLVRAPFGAWNAGVARAVNGSAMKKYVGSVFWDEGGALTANAAADWDCWGKGVSVQRCGELYLKEIRSKKRGVVLMHDIHDKTVDMVKQILPTLIAEGYKFSALEDVPSVKRAIVGAGTPAADDQCQSATLGRAVNENVCVQSRSNQKWSRCVDGEWLGSTGPTDTKCTQRFPL
jgi:peptidoglycan/xylan/chitin deacetylase (PgdA/CDA1 family)